MQTSPIQAVPAVCKNGLGLKSVRIEPQLQTIGPSSNVITRTQNTLWIVESGANTLSTFDLNTQTLKANVLDVGNDRNPYDVAFDEDAIYVTNYLKHSVSWFDRTSKKLVREIEHESLQYPSGVTSLGPWLYVSNVNYINNQEGYKPSTISVFSKSDGAFAGTITLDARNAQYLSTLTIDGAQRVVVVNTGSIKFGAEGAQISTPGQIEIWTPTADALQPQKQTFPMPLQEDKRINGPGRVMQTDQGDLYFSSATAPVLFKLNPMTKTWSNNTDNPLRFAPTATDALHHSEIDARGIIWITSFNEDVLYAWDTTCDRLLAGPFDLGIDENMIEGPHGLAVQMTPNGVDLYYIMTLSNTLGRVKITFEEPS